MSTGVFRAQDKIKNARGRYWKTLVAAAWPRNAESSRYWRFPRPQVENCDLIQFAGHRSTPEKPVSVRY